MASLREQLRAVMVAVQERPELAEDPEVIKGLAELEDLRQRNPLQFFEPDNPKQEAYLSSGEVVKGFFGGNGSGKSTVGMGDDLIQAVDRECLPAHLLPYKRFEPPCFQRVVVPKADQVESVVLEKVRELCPANQLLGGGVDKAYNKVNRKLLFRNGSWMVFNTHEQDRDAHAGIELHRVRFDEEPPGEHGKGLYTENVARLRRFMPRAQVSFTMTPLFGLSWTFDEVWERRGREVSSGVYRNAEASVFCVVSSMLENSFVDGPSMLRALGHLSEEERSAIIDGKFVHFHGAVLNVPGHLVVDPIEPGHLDGQDVYVGIDPGIRRGGVVWVAFDVENRMLVFDELYPENLTVGEIAEQIHAKNRRWGVRDPLYVMDPSGRNRQLTNAESVEGEFAREGIYCSAGQNDRLAGVLQLRGRLQHDALMVTRNCVDWLRESQRWLVAKDEVTEQQKHKAKGSGGTFATIGPDHLMDPTRYVAMERLWWSADVPEPPAQRVWTPGTAPAAEFFGRREVVGPMGSMS